MALDKRPRVRPVGIGETLHQALVKVVMREARDQAKTACGNLQLYVGPKDGIERATHAVVQRRINRVRGRRCKEEEAENSVVEEKESRGVAEEIGILSIYMAGTKEEAAEGLAPALGMEIE